HTRDRARRDDLRRRRRRTSTCISITETELKEPKTMTTFDRQAVMDSLSRLVTPGIKLTALADELGARKHEYAELRSIMFDLVEEGTVHVLAGGAFALAPTGRASDPQ